VPSAVMVMLHVDLRMLVGSVLRVRVRFGAATNGIEILART